MTFRRSKLFLLALALVPVTAQAVPPEGNRAAARDVPLRNWNAPQLWVAPAGSRDAAAAAQDAAAAAIAGLPAGRQALATFVDTAPLEFVPITPCRVADTRGNGFTGNYGPPSLLATSARTMTVTGVCGIPTGAQAASFQFTALNMNANGNLIAFPAGGSTPTTSVLNWTATSGVAGNGNVVGLSTAGALTVVVNGALGTFTDMVIDVNGYYGPVGNLPSGTSATYLTVTASPFYTYPVTVTLAGGGVCHVTSEAQIQVGGAAPTSGQSIFFRIAIKRGAAADTNDGSYGHYFNNIAANSYSGDLTRAFVITLNPGEATQLGCYINGVSSADIAAADVFLGCQTSFVCY
jgi:hypothetical protein